MLVAVGVGICLAVVSIPCEVTESINLGKSPENQQIRYKLCMEQGQDAGSLGKMQRKSSQCMLYNEWRVNVAS